MTPEPTLSTAASGSHLPEWLPLVGAIVLATQEAERMVKVVVSICGSTTGETEDVMRRWEKLGEQSFGQAIGAFKKSGRLDGQFERQLNQLVKDRNAVVHDFARTYGDRIGAGQEAEVIAELRLLLRE